MRSDTRSDQHHGRGRRLTAADIPMPPARPTAAELEGNPATERRFENLERRLLAVEQGQYLTVASRQVMEARIEQRFQRHLEQRLKAVAKVEKKAERRVLREVAVAERRLGRQLEAVGLGIEKRLRAEHEKDLRRLTSSAATSLRSRSWWASRSPAEIEAFRKKLSAGVRRSWDSHPERRAATSARMREWWATRTPEERAQIGANRQRGLDRKRRERQHNAGS